MEINYSAYFLFTGCGVLLSVLWFFLADRRKARDGKSLPLSLLVTALGILLGLCCARLVWFLCRINTRPALFGLRYNELSYYGGMAGVILAVVLAAKVLGRGIRETLNTFAPMGALTAAVMRFGEGFLGLLGMGKWLEEGIFFPVTAEIVWDESYSDFYLAIFMLEGLFSLIAMVLSLVHGKEKYRWVRTLFYLCLPQILCESMRSESLSWLFVRAEQLFCFLLCEGVLVWYAVRRGPGRFRSWIPALTGLFVVAVVVVGEFALDGKITFGEAAAPHWAIYLCYAAALALLAAAEHRGRPAEQEEKPV